MQTAAPQPAGQCIFNMKHQRCLQPGEKEQQQRSKKEDQHSCMSRGQSTQQQKEGAATGGRMIQEAQDMASRQQHPKEQSDRGKEEAVDGGPEDGKTTAAHGVDGPMR